MKVYKSNSENWVFKRKKGVKGGDYVIPDEVAEYIEQLQQENERFRKGYNDAGRCLADKREAEKKYNDLLAENERNDLLAENERQRVKVKQLEQENEELKDFAIWMTGCGYDFTSLDYFNKMRDKLLLNKNPKEGE
jgi:4-diphosphocytidyl-2C-methyl-D-erythritol kinase